MSTLNESLQARRITVPSPEQLGYSIKPQNISLRLKCSAGQSWTLPWAHFSFAHLAVVESSEKLVLTFASHEVIIHGKNLQTLDDEAANCRLEKLHATALKYALSDSEVRIESISVKLLSDKKKALAD
jgi:hypothetical protein